MSDSEAAVVLVVMVEIVEAVDELTPAIATSTGKKPDQ
jgi:hypothetical protein